MIVCILVKFELLVVVGVVVVVVFVVVVVGVFLVLGVVGCDIGVSYIVIFNSMVMFVVG